MFVCLYVDCSIFGPYRSAAGVSLLNNITAINPSFSFGFASFSITLVAAFTERLFYAADSLWREPKFL